MSTCKICDSHLTDYCLFHYSNVCDSCAEIIANQYSFAHSRTYLTWPNDRLSGGQPKKPISEKSRWEVYQRDNYSCVHCGSKSRLTIDHIIPESKGGKNKIDNYQTLCKRCNSSKGNRV